MSVAALFTIAKTWERNNAICSNMVATRDYHTKRSKSERERQIPYDITFMQNLKYDTNEPMYKTEQTWGHREQNGDFLGTGDQWRDGVGG